MIVMGAAADPKLLAAVANDAHHRAIGSVKGPNRVTYRADWDNLNVAVTAPVPEKMVMDVCDFISAVIDPQVPTYMKRLVNGAVAAKVCNGCLAAQQPFAHSTHNIESVVRATAVGWWH